MRFARLRDEEGRDIHVWVDDGFDKNAANMVINMLKVMVEAEKKMGKHAIQYTFSDTEYVETPQL